MRNFVINKISNGEYYFNLKADNSQIILTSQMYFSRSDCNNDIESVRNNCTDETVYESKRSFNNKYYFVFRAANGKLIGNSELYSSGAGMEDGIESVKKNKDNLKVVEEEPYF
jgi:uncharacterized protein